MKPLRTLTTLLTVAALIAAWAIPVSAGKPPTNETVEVTMSLVDADGDGITQGLTTGCDDGDGANGYLLMTRDRKGLVGGPSAIVLGLFMNDVDWSRHYPASSGIGFAECHGETVASSPIENVTYGGLGMNIDRSGAVTDVLWHFDYYLDGDYIELRNGRVRFQDTVREYFTLTGNDLEWNDANSTVSGWFHLSHSVYDAENEIGYEAFPGSPQWMEFTITIEPQG